MIAPDSITLYMETAILEEKLSECEEEDWGYGTEYIRADLVPQWQPIETAPKDGTSILIYTQGMVIEARYCTGSWSEDTPISPAEYDGAVWCAFDDALAFEIEETPHGDFCGEVTHWQPLPEPPQ